MFWEVQEVKSLRLPTCLRPAYSPLDQHDLNHEQKQNNMETELRKYFNYKKIYFIWNLFFKILHKKCLKYKIKIIIKHVSIVSSVIFLKQKAK